MSYFIQVQCPAQAQVGDKVRISLSESFLTQDEAAVTLVEIEPDTGVGFVDVTNVDQTRWYLDWAYDSANTKTVTARVTTDTVYTKTQSIEVLTFAADSLFSSDQDLKSYEPDILKWLPIEYSNWNHIHRECQRNILNHLDELRIYKPDGSKFQASDILHKSEVRRLSAYMALRMIFSGLSNQVDDIFNDKRLQYKELEKMARNRNYLTLDLDGDGIEDGNEKIDKRTFTMVRR